MLEIAVGLAPLAGVFARTTAIASAVLRVVFLLGMGTAWARGRQIDTGYPGEIARDTALPPSPWPGGRRPGWRGVPPNERSMSMSGESELPAEGLTAAVAAAQG